jgi:hypothetical protein
MKLLSRETRVEGALAICLSIIAGYLDGYGLLVFGTLSHIPFLEVFEQPAIVQMQIKFCVYWFGWFTPCHRKKPGFSIREIEALKEWTSHDASRCLR